MAVQLSPGIAILTTCRPSDPNHSDVPWEQRRVRSKLGYRKVEGTVNVGNVTGVNNNGEAAYNYFGISREGYFDFEGGVYRYASGPNWFVFHSLNGQTVPDNWPAGGITPGTDVFIQISVQVNNRVVMFVSYSPPGNLNTAARTWEYDTPGLDAEGKGQRIRRNTTFKVDTTGASQLNSWTSVSAGTVTSLHLWVPSDTYDYEATPNVIIGPNPVPDHTELVSIVVN